MKIEQYKYQEKKESDVLSRNRTEKRKLKRILSNFYNKNISIIDPYWWGHLTLSEKNVIYRSQLGIPHEAKKVWFEDMYDEYNKKQLIRNTKIEEILE